MPLNLNSDNLKIVAKFYGEPIIGVKPDYQPIHYTGYTPTILIGSGSTIPTNVSGTTWIVYTPAGGVNLTGSGATSVTGSGTTWTIYSPPESYTGDSTVLIGSGGTWVGKISGDTWVVYSPDWTADILGLTISAQTAYECCTGLTATFNDYTGDTFITLSGITVAGALLQAQTNNLQQAFTGHTGTTEIHTPYSAITFAISAATSGLTSSWSGLTGLPTDNADLAAIITGITADTQTNYECCTGNTADIAYISGQTDYHYQQFTGFTDYFNTLVLPAITGNTADIAYVSGQTEIAQQCCTGLTSSFTGHTGQTGSGSIHFTGHTFTQSGITVITQFGDNVNIFVPPDAITGITWSGVTNKPSWLSGTTLSAFETGHTHSQYITGATSTLSGCTDVTITSPADNDILKYSGTTWVNEAPIDLFDNVPDLYMLRRSGSTVVGIPYSIMTGATGASGLTPTVTWSGMTGIPAWLSGTTLQTFQTGHTHSQYLTGFTVTCGMISGCTTGLTADINYISGITSGNTADIQWLSGYTSGHTHDYVTNAVFSGYTGATNLTLTGITADISYLSGQTEIAQQCCTGLTATFTGYTGSTYLTLTGITADINYLSGITSGHTADISYISGVTDSHYQELTGLTSSFDSHTGNTVIHFSGHTFTQSGITVITQVNDNINIYVPPDAISAITWNNVTGKPAWITGDTAAEFASGHTHPQYITGATASGGTTVSIVNGNLTIYSITGSTGGGVSEATFTGYTATTAPATYATKLVTINSVTAVTYTTVAGDSNEIIECASGCTGVTLHSGATTGFQITFVSLGTQDITFAAQTGSTLRSKGSKTKLGNQYGAVTCYKNGTYWTLIGDIE